MGYSVQRFATGGDRNFGYLAVSKGRAAVVDPSPDPDPILSWVQKRRLQVDYIFITHKHADHTAGSAAAARAWARKPLHFGDREASTGRLVRHGARFPLGDIELTVLHTPGHTADSICIHAGTALFTGDTLFVGKVGGTDLGRAARTQYDSLHSVLLSLPGATRIFPGHDYGQKPQSTLREERRNNPFLIQPDLDSFVHLKRTWADYKRAHGIP